MVIEITNLNDYLTAELFDDCKNFKVVTYFSKLFSKTLYKLLLTKSK